MIGRLNYHIIVDQQKEADGIQELRYIDPRRIRKIREVTRGKDAEGRETIKNVQEYYLYNESGIVGIQTQQAGAIQIAKDSIASVTSGLQDSRRAMVLSHLQKGIKPLNLLRMLEDACVVYKVSRAPDRRCFFIDVGNLPKTKAEQYIRDMMTKYRNKIIYDSCLDMETLIPLLDGRTLSLRQIEEEYKKGERLWVYSCDPKTGEFAPGLVHWAGQTKANTEVMKITFDNGKELICTPDHKFPLWEKGKTEAKDLVPGDSIIPFYSRQKNIAKNASDRNNYLQMYDHISQEWKFVHRLVSKWKDKNNIKNEWVYKTDNPQKRTIHHKNYDRYNNNPENLTRMNRDDHFKYHHDHHNSLAGKKGGAIAGKKCKELGLGIFSAESLAKRKGHLTTPENKEKARIRGLKLVEEKIGIHRLTPEQIKENSLKAVEALKEKRKDPIFAEAWSNSVKATWNDERREKLSIRMKNMPKEYYEELHKHSVNIKELNEKRWSDPEWVAKFKDTQTIVYPENIFDIIIQAAKEVKTYNDAIILINQRINKEEWKQLNLCKTVRLKDFNDLQFTYKDLKRVISYNGFKGWKDFRKSLSFHNHKIVKVEFLTEKRDVGTLNIDKHHIYHDYHTFALDVGVFTFNSSGQIQGDRKFISMQEDIWLPRRGESGKGTEIETLPGGESFDKMDMVDYFKRKLYESLEVPIGRLIPSEGFSLGKSNEITREELAFAKFITRLRRRFGHLFNILMGVQLVFKGICSREEWEAEFENLFYEWRKDSNFEELKNAELWTMRIQLLAQADPYIGRFFSGKWAQKNILMMTDEEIEEMQNEIGEETEKQSITLPPNHPMSPFYVPPESPDAEDQQPNIDQTASEAMTPGQSDVDSAFKGLKMNEETNISKKLNIIKEILEKRKNQHV